MSAPVENEGGRLTGNIKVTRQDWLNVAMDTLISDGIDHVKVLTLAHRLEVSRSSFYWYFKSRQDLLDALLDHWLATNTQALVTHATKQADTIAAAVCNVFLGFIDPAQFNNKLDFAIRDWARKSGKVRRIMDRSDGQRVDALTQMFARYGFDEEEALTRARTLYYMQIGYNDAELQEPMDERLRLVPNYIFVFTGTYASAQEIRMFRQAVLATQGA